MLIKLDAKLVDEAELTHHLECDRCVRKLDERGEISQIPEENHLKPISVATVTNTDRC